MLATRLVVSVDEGWPAGRDAGTAMSLTIGLGIVGAAVCGFILLELQFPARELADFIFDKILSSNGIHISFGYFQDYFIRYQI
jgi:hypothetical protein